MGHAVAFSLHSGDFHCRCVMTFVHELQFRLVKDSVRVHREVFVLFVQKILLYFEGKNLLCVPVDQYDVKMGVTSTDSSTVFTFMHLADAFIQSDLQCFQAIHFFSMYARVCMQYFLHKWNAGSPVILISQLEHFVAFAEVEVISPA